MSSVLTSARIIREAMRVGWQDFHVLWSWWTWFGSYVPRLFFQVVYFTLIGALLHSPDRAIFLAIGNSLMVGPIITMLAVQATVWERWLGTVPLLVAAPSSPLLIFAGRSVEWLAQGVVTSLLVFAIALPVLHVAIQLPGSLMLVPMVALTCLSTYAFALFLGGLVLRAPGARNLVSTLASMVLMTLAGVNVQATFFPAPVAALSQILPVTHGLLAVRALLDGATAAAVATQASLEALVGVGWLAVAMLSFQRLLDGTRRTGAVDLDG
jgi:ABC-2 type transport system permease protein